MHHTSAIKLTGLLVRGEVKECERVSVDEHSWQREDSKDTQFTWATEKGINSAAKQRKMIAFCGGPFSSIEENKTLDNMLK